MFRHPHTDEGVTLVELLVALVVMALISTAVLEGITTLANASKNHRGIATVDAATTAYAEAIKHHVDFTTRLASDLNASANTISVNSVAELSASNSSPLEVLIDGELIKVTGVNQGAKTLSVAQRGDRGTAATSHTTGTQLTPSYTPCPDVSTLTPLTYQTATYPAVALPTFTLEYWVPTGGGSFVSRSACMTYFRTQTACTGFSGTDPFQDDNQPDCDPGIQRATVTAVGDATTGNSKTTTVILLRRGDG